MGTAQKLSAYSRVSHDFFLRDVLEVAPDLIGKQLVRQFDEGKLISSRITEVEAYRGGDDLACHASKGRTSRTEVMFGPGGFVYVYLIYGMYWMLNFVCNEPDIPQAVLVRGLDTVSGPGRLSRDLGIAGDFYGEDLGSSGRIWLENNNEPVEVRTGARIGIEYAGEYWASRPWRYMAVEGKS